MSNKTYKGKKVAFFTLGCKLNFAETSALARQFEELGFERVRYKDVADVYVVNSCSVTAESDKKSRNMIRGAIRRNPHALMIVTGCYAQLKSEEIALLKGVDYILGSAEKMNMIRYVDNLKKSEEPVVAISGFRKIEKFFPAYSFGDRTRSFLKVQDGCNYFCTYCTIPYARGKSRNDTIANTVAKAGEVVQKGAKEIILTGVNIGDYGRSTGESFIGLLKALDDVKGLERIRISSVEPNLLTDEIIEFVASSKHYMPHFHIPLQSGSNEVLALMKRKYKRELFAERVEKIRSLLPDAFIGVDVIAGTNGETDAFFLDTYNFIRDLDISQLHAFPYSERPGTQALKIPHVVPVPVRKERVQRLIELSERKHRLFCERFLGETRPVLFESEKKQDAISGWTDNYIRVTTDWDKNLANKIYHAKLESIDETGSIKGKIITG
ncbi:MAG: tRNA (N(6)-L-threonylcarbamoyladenosine(37)-C(2))-methylthiotransferase MtaB [Prolixibacteraceae bacterium]|nr:tRNA (N(6)-L-threonylcarbamoyladenosine(37)-C(2))-methylthiotransferase MtaB [Prolixibacteraceae bacterium]